MLPFVKTSSAGSTLVALGAKLSNRRLSTAKMVLMVISFWLESTRPERYCRESGRVISQRAPQQNDERRAAGSADIPVRLSAQREEILASPAHLHISSSSRLQYNSAKQSNVQTKKT